MKASVRSLLDPAINPQGPLLGATVLVVGGGAGADLPHWRALQAQRLVVYEPQPALADELQRKLRADAGETLVCAAVAPTECQLTLQVLNNPRESAPALPTGLLAHQPRLQRQSTLVVQAHALVHAVELLQLPDAAPHLLVLDAPGQAGAILQASISALQRFAWLVLRTGTEALYEGDLPCAELTELLQRAGFDLVADDADALPPHRELLWHRSLPRVQALLTQQQLEAALADLAQARTEAQAQAQQMAQLSAQLAELLDDQRRRQNDLQQAAIANKALDKAREAALGLAAERQDQLSAAQDALQARQAELAQRAADHTALEAAAEQQQRRIAALVLAQADAQRQADQAALDQAAQDAELRAELQTQIQQAAERAAQSDALTLALVDAQASAASQAVQIAQLGQAHDTQAQLAAERQARVDALGAAQAAAEQAIAEGAEQAAQLGHALAAAAQEGAERQTRIDALTQQGIELAEARDAQAKLAAERQGQIEALSAGKAAAEQSAAERAKQIDAVTQAKAASDKTAADRQAQIDALAQEKAQLTEARDAQAKLAADRQAQVDALAAGKAAADQSAADRAKQIEAITQAKSAAEITAAECQVQIHALVHEKARFLACQEALNKDKADLSQQLQTKARASDEQALLLKAADAENRNLAARQQLMNDELLKAEAQIELIKDLFLREPRL